MNAYRDEALKKLREGAKNGHYDRHAQAMKDSVRATLENFCSQDEEFAQAVVQGGSFEDCMKAVAKGVGQSISDLDAYRKAVQFFFPGAEIRMQMTIDLVGAAAGEEEPKTEAKPSGILLDFTQFL